ncbi:HAD family hydrolase [Campylobacter sp. CCUG 57310]|uniref:HAD family hydrolase n=1 Tax=Campylobacter sp. CCUG 57310 TaxID=2517362 RepID=UPI0015649DBF|nr:HAD family hydrolase [Campylobacter sp. CCUG 57310]QKF92099.1 phosphoglycolate phosphatase-like HAD superfamily hydrolase [Campylobacter sp. CCUG 57310]
MKTIIFDMDGTLIDSSKAICVTVNEVRRELGFKSDLSEEFIVRAINEVGRDLGKEFYGLNVINSKLRDGFEVKFKINYDKYARAYQGVDELLKKCVEANYFVALASNAPNETLKDILIKSNIYKYFNHIIGASKDVPQKPDPTMINLLKDMGGFSKVLFVGDSYKDELAAINAKVDYINVCWGFGAKSKDAINIYDTQKSWQYIESL